MTGTASGQGEANIAFLLSTLVRKMSHFVKPVLSSLFVYSYICAEDLTKNVLVLNRLYRMYFPDS